MAADSARMADRPSERVRLEASRLKAVRDLDILDTPNEGSYNRVVSLIRKVFGVQIGSISILDGHRVWMKAIKGTDTTEAAREDTFSQYTIRQDGPFVVPDTTQDERFADNPFVTGPPHVRFYAGIPMHSSSGHCVGAICAVDTKPRTFGPKHLDILNDLGTVVVQQMELREQALSDGLTGLLTRRAFREASARSVALAARHKNPLAAICFDLDHFKSINDTFGHAAGDEVLSTVAATCQHRMRKSDLFGRLGGEEFGVLLPETDRQGAMEVAEKLRRDIRELRFEFGGETVGITASFGVATLGGEISDLETLLVRADASLYQAKSEGRNRCVAFGTSEVTVKAARRRVLKAGKVSFNNGGASIDCTVRTIGADGAGLDLISTADVPNAFRLIIRSDGLDASCKVSARTRTHLEVEFR